MTQSELDALAANPKRLAAAGQLLAEKEKAADADELEAMRFNHLQTVPSTSWTIDDQAFVRAACLKVLRPQ